jgi:hypothetical protein
MRILVATLFVLVGIVNLLPVTGVLSASRLQALYGIAVTDPDLLILLRHRAVLFGVIGALLVVAACHSPLRSTAIAAGLVSMLSFVVIAFLVGGVNSELRRIVVIDLAASLALVAAAVLWVGFTRSG